MFRRVSGWILVGCAILAITGCCIPKPLESLPVTLHPQETRMWCWAASGQMVMDYLGHDVSQCVQANNRFGRTDCCDGGPCPFPNCVSGGWPEFEKYGFTCKITSDAALSWVDLKRQISTSTCCLQKPFCFTWHSTFGGGHMMVAIGYMTIVSAFPSFEIDLVEVLDPWPPCVGDHYFITYDWYVESPGHHTHWNDYYDVTYVGGE